MDRKWGQLDKMSALVKQRKEGEKNSMWNGILIF
jgi:hypothetical protein